MENFKRDVDAGLSAPQKSLPSKYFYDARGSQLFVEIMNSEEYYLTDAEHEILREQTQAIISAFGVNGDHFELVELGAGDGTKTLELLREMEGVQKFDYMPIDISSDALDQLKDRLKEEVPGVFVKPQHGTYFTVLEEIRAINNPMIILFLGSNLGNMLDDSAHDFINHLAHAMNPGDMLLLGVDVKKSKRIVLPAYNDSKGITSAFNLNILRRINRELNADFKLDAFVHDPCYDEKEGIAYSYLKSLADQDVTIRDLNKKFRFKKGECIHTEISRKYDDATVSAIIKDTGLAIKTVFTDSQNYFADYLLMKE